MTWKSSLCTTTTSCSDTLAKALTLTLMFPNSSDLLQNCTLLIRHPLSTHRRATQPPGCFLLGIEPASISDRKNDLRARLSLSQLRTTHSLALRPNLSCPIDHSKPAPQRNNVQVTSQPHARVRSQNHCPSRTHQSPPTISTSITVNQNQPFQPASLINQHITETAVISSKPNLQPCPLSSHGSISY